MARRCRAAIQPTERADPGHRFHERLGIFGRGAWRGRAHAVQTARGPARRRTWCASSFRTSRPSEREKRSRSGDSIASSSRRVAVVKRHLPSAVPAGREVHGDRGSLPRAEKLMVVGDDERALGGVERQRTRRRRVGTRFQAFSNSGRSLDPIKTRLVSRRAGRKSGEADRAHEETGGDHDCAPAEAERIVRLEHRIQVRPGDEEAHHLRLARARCELATELRPGVTLRIQRVDVSSV